MRTPSPWWILAPLITLISSCIISIPLSFEPPIPSHNFFDKTDTSEEEKKSHSTSTRNGYIGFFSSNPDDLSIQAQKCHGEIKIVNGNFSRKIPMNYDINEDIITLSFNDMSLICHLEHTNGYINYSFYVKIGSRSLYDSMDTSTSGRVEIKLPKVVDQHAEIN